MKFSDYAIPVQPIAFQVDFWKGSFFQEMFVSHIVQIQTEVRDAVAVGAACERLKLPQPSERSVQLFSGEVKGWAIDLPGWRYPVVCDLANGRLQFDNYGGHWKDQA